MTKRTLLIALLLAGVAAGPVYAQDRPYGGGNISVASPTAPAADNPAIPRKAVKDMTPQERKDFWDSLPQADKDRIIAHRREAMEHNAKFGRSSGKDVAAERPESGEAVKTPAEKLEDMGPERREQAKAAWENMTDEQRKAFVAEHAAQIKAGIAAQGAAGR